MKNLNSCCKATKATLSKYCPVHKKCNPANKRINDYHPPIMVRGSKLNLFLRHHDRSIIQNNNDSVVKPFKPNKLYKVCKNMRSLMRLTPASRTTKSPTNNQNHSSSAPIHHMISRTKTPSPPSNTYALRSKRSFDTAILGVDDEDKEAATTEPPVGEPTPSPSPSKPWLSKSEIFEGDVLRRNYYRVKFQDLVMTERQRKKMGLMKMILSMCIDSNRFRKESQSYYEGNEDIMIAALDLIDGTKLYLEKYLKMQFNEISDEVLEPVIGDTDGLIQELSPKQRGYEFAIKILGETSFNGHERLKKEIETAGGLEGIDLPTSYIVKKKRPKIMDVSFQTGVVLNHRMIDKIIN